MSSVLPANADPHVFLIGRPPMTEYLGFITENTIDGQSADQSVLADTWRRAYAHTRRMEQDDAGAADAAPLTGLTRAQQIRRDRLLSDPLVQRSFGLTPTEVALVDLDTLVVHQKNINLAYVEQLQAQVPGEPSDVELFDFALPTDRRYDAPVHGGRTAPNAFSFSSASTDLRLLGAKVVDPSQIAGPVDGAPAAVVAILVGYGSNLLSAVQIQGRLILNNGSHRAYALRDLGHRHVPCLIQQLTHREELEVTGVAPVAQHPDLYLQAARPPMLKDYFDDELRMIVTVPRKRRQVQVQFGVQVSDSF